MPVNNLEDQNLQEISSENIFSMLKYVTSSSTSDDLKQYPCDIRKMVCAQLEYCILSIMK